MFFFFNDTATTEIYTLPYTTLFRSHRPLGLGLDLAQRAQDLPGDGQDERVTAVGELVDRRPRRPVDGALGEPRPDLDRKSTRLNSSHANISYAVFCLKKKTMQ